MLVLKRGLGQRLVLEVENGEAGRSVVEVCVISVQHGRVKLGINAPRDITILREELARYPESQTSQGKGKAETKTKGRTK